MSSEYEIRQPVRRHNGWEVFVYKEDFMIWNFFRNDFTGHLCSPEEREADLIREERVPLGEAAAIARAATDMLEEAWESGRTS